MAAARRKPDKSTVGKATSRPRTPARKRSAAKKTTEKQHKTSSLAKSAADGAEAFLREAALEYPEAYEEFPWGERAIKVHKKIFVFLSRRVDDGGIHFTVKLPESAREALLLPCSEPTHYGMGKHGWVTMHFAADEQPPLGLLVDWIDESYRAIAPKRLISRLADD